MNLPMLFHAAKHSASRQCFGGFTQPLLAFLLVIAAGNNALAGETEIVETKTVTPVKLEEPWVFKLGVPGWLANVSGEVGIRNHNTDVNVQVDTILRHLDMTGSFSVEGRKGRFGFYSDFLYLGDSASQASSGLVSNLGLKANEWLAEFELTGRVVDTPNGWIDVRAGFRYTNLFSSLSLSPNNDRINQASANFVDATSAVVERLLNSDLKGALDGQHPELAVPPLAADQQNILRGIINRLNSDPELQAAIQSGDPAQIAAQKSRIQKEIARALKNRLSRTFALQEDWFDPYIGFACRQNLSKAFYLTGKADIGGFGVGSNLTVQAYGALGCQITRWLWAELGYRLLWVDYRANGFVYNVTDAGVQFTGGVNF